MKKKHRTKMAEILKPGTNGSARIDHITARPGEIEAERLNIPPGVYARLFIDGILTMSDTPMEWRTSMNFITSSFGDVLIGGLGMGMVLLEVQRRNKVASITVVEKNRDVIDLVTPQLSINSDKVKIVHGDIFSYVPDHKFDLIYIDIWPEISPTIYIQEMLPLKRRYNAYLKPPLHDGRRQVQCWAEYEAKHKLELR